MKVLKEIIKQLGYVTSDQLPTMAEEYSYVPLVIKWGYKERQQFFASEIKSKIEAEEDDYVREVFMSSKTLKYITGLVNQFEDCPEG